MVRCTELAASAVRTITESMNRWQQGNLHDEEPELTTALRIVIDLSGGLRWVEKHPCAEKQMEQVGRLGEYTPAQWRDYHSELQLTYHGIDLWLLPHMAETLMTNAVI